MRTKIRLILLLLLLCLIAILRRCSCMGQKHGGQRLQNSIQTFINICPRRILQIRWAWQNQQHRLVVEKKPSPNRRGGNEAKVGMVEVDRIHSTQDTCRHHRASPLLEPPGKRERGRSRNTWQRELV